MGRDLLAQDYMLKQITASLIYPQDNLGKKFWDRVYAKAQEQFGTTNVPVNTFNKVWILPDDALIYEKGSTAYVLKNHLKVMLEEDYLSLQKHSGITSAVIPAKGRIDRHSQLLAGIHNKSNINTLSSQIIRRIVLPELEREVNEGKNFAALRQVYSGMLLAAWYKRALKESLLSKIYANKSRVKGVDQNPRTNEEIYRQYLKAYKKGVFNFIKEDVDKYTNEMIPRKYFSGGTGNYAMASKYFKKSPFETTNSLTARQRTEMLKGCYQDDVATVATEEVNFAMRTKIPKKQVSVFSIDQVIKAILRTQNSGFWSKKVNGQIQMDGNVAIQGKSHRVIIKDTGHLLFIDVFDWDRYWKEVVVSHLSLDPQERAAIRNHFKWEHDSAMVVEAAIDALEKLKRGKSRFIIQAQLKEMDGQKFGQFSDTAKAAIEQKRNALLREYKEVLRDEGLTPEAINQFDVIDIGWDPFVGNVEFELIVKLDTQYTQGAEVAINNLKTFYDNLKRSKQSVDAIVRADHELAGYEYPRNQQEINRLIAEMRSLFGHFKSFIDSGIESAMVEPYNGYRTQESIDSLGARILQLGSVIESIEAESVSLPQEPSDAAMDTEKIVSTGSTRHQGDVDYLLLQLGYSANFKKVAQLLGAIVERTQGNPRYMPPEKLRDLLKTLPGFVSLGSEGDYRLGELASLMLYRDSGDPDDTLRPDDQRAAMINYVKNARRITVKEEFEGIRNAMLKESNPQELERRIEQWKTRIVQHSDLLNARYMAPFIKKEREYKEYNQLTDLLLWVRSLSSVLDIRTVEHLERRIRAAMLKESDPNKLYRLIDLWYGLAGRLGLLTAGSMAPFIKKEQEAQGYNPFTDLLLRVMSLPHVLDEVTIRHLVNRVGGKEKADGYPLQGELIWRIGELVNQKYPQFLSMGSDLRGFFVDALARELSVSRNTGSGSARISFEALTNVFKSMGYPEDLLAEATNAAQRTDAAMVTVGMIRRVFPELVRSYKAALEQLNPQSNPSALVSSRQELITGLAVIGFWRKNVVRIMNELADMQLSGDTQAKIAEKRSIEKATAVVMEGEEWAKRLIERAKAEFTSKVIAEYPLYFNPKAADLFNQELNAIEDPGELFSFLRSIYNSIKEREFFNSFEEQREAQHMLQAISEMGNRYHFLLLELTIIGNRRSPLIHDFGNDDGHQVDKRLDAAMTAAPHPAEYGGIDFNAAHLNLQIKRDGYGVALPVSQQNLENIKIDGLIPIIIEIKSASSLPFFSALQK